MVEELLIPKEEYLSYGIHIGMKSKNASMKRFIYKIREDGLSVLNLKLLDERIGIAAKFLAKNKKILIVGRKANAQKGAKKLAKIATKFAAIENLDAHKKSAEIRLKRND